MILKAEPFYFINQKIYTKSKEIKSIQRQIDDLKSNVNNSCPLNQQLTYTEKIQLANLVHHKYLLVKELQELEAEKDKQIKAIKENDR